MVSLIPTANSLVKDYINNFILRKVDQLDQPFLLLCCSRAAIEKEATHRRCMCIFGVIFPSSL